MGRQWTACPELTPSLRVWASKSPGRLRPGGSGHLKVSATRAHNLRSWPFWTRPGPRPHVGPAPRGPQHQPAGPAPGPRPPHRSRADPVPSPWPPAHRHGTAGSPHPQTDLPASRGIPSQRPPRFGSSRPQTPAPSAGARASRQTPPGRQIPQTRASLRHLPAQTPQAPIRVARPGRALRRVGTVQRRRAQRHGSRRGPSALTVRYQTHRQPRGCPTPSRPAPPTDASSQVDAR